MFCQKCGAEALSSQQFCGSCGADLSTAEKFSRASKIIISVIIVLFAFVFLRLAISGLDVERDSRTTSDKDASSSTLTTAAQTEVRKAEAPASLSSPKASVDQIGTANPAAQGSPDFSSIHETAQQGDAEAQNTLGLLYEKGQGVAQDYVQAAAWYRLAAEQGNADAQCNLARLYLRGLLGAGPAGIDYGDAFYWYRLAADQGSAIAEVAVGNLYFSSLGVPPQMENYTLAIYWCTKAAEQGNPYAEESLGRFYSDPHGAGYWNVQPDFIKSFYWRHKAAEDGNGMAQAELSDMDSRENDYADAYFWWLVGKPQEHPDSEQAQESDDQREHDLASHLTPAQISGVQERVRRWFEDHPSKAP